MGGGIMGPMTFFFPATLFVVLFIYTDGRARMKVLIWFLFGAAGPFHCEEHDTCFQHRSILHLPVLSLAVLAAAV